jgi:hypothetical protein
MTTTEVISHLARQARLAATSVLCTLAVLGLLSATAPAQTLGRQTFNVPFAFVAGKKLCPAGTYTVRSVSPDILAITGVDSSTRLLLRTRTEPGTQQNNRAALIFNQYGDSHYLSQIRPPFETSFMQLPRSHDEQQVAKAWAEHREAIVAAATSKD